ncbi:Conserved_hypothetical protein [Hexamita inflata]|uniref:Uncharacterized protein n=1 Tax=Hexamita inflata TaxID=28002 RepID=A0AA86PFJ8_9EUKA|nr:Conserved hypothetical protein [Hexamita inflata]
MQRVRISDAEKLEFHKYLSHVMNVRLHLNRADTIPADELCTLYDQLDNSAKPGIFEQVSIYLSKTVTWVTKFYHNTFRKSRFSSSLSEQQKINLETLVHSLYKKNTLSKYILEEAYELINDPNIFPNKISSFVYQSIERAKNGFFYTVKQEVTSHPNKENTNTYNNNNNIVVKNEGQNQNEIQNNKIECESQNKFSTQQIEVELRQFQKLAELTTKSTSQEMPVYNQFSQPTLNDMEVLRSLKCLSQGQQSQVQFQFSQE